MRRWLRPLWFVLALLFLLEAWLWERLQPVAARLVALIPLEEMKARLSREVAHLGPRDSFYVLCVPSILYTLVEVYALVPLSEGRWLYALMILSIAKIIGAAVTSFVFDVVRDKVLQLGWFRRLYTKIIGWRVRALRLVAPYLENLRVLADRIRAAAFGEGAVGGGVIRALRRMRARTRLFRRHRTRAAR